MNKKQFLLVMLTGAFSATPLYAMQGVMGAGGPGGNVDDRNAAARRAAEALARGMGDVANDLAGLADQRRRRLQQQILDRRIELQEIIDSRRSSEAEKNVARAELQRLDARAARNEEAMENLGNQAMGMGVNLVGQLGQAIVNDAAAQAEQARKRELAAIEAGQRRKAIVEATQASINAVMDNPKKIVGMAGGIAGLYYLAQHGIPMILDQYSKPELADPDKTSMSFGMLNWFNSLIFGAPDHKEESLSDVILHPELAARLTDLVTSLKNTVMNGGYLKHVMLWGQPGTGKTMFAMRMARACGLHYIYFAASSLEQFSTEEATKLLTQLFRFAKNCPEKLVIIIDEAELLLGQRGGDSTDKKSTLLNLILTETGTESRDLMVIALTNRPEDIDEAFLSRTDERIEIAAPAAPERRAILQLYVDKILKKASNLKPHQSSMFSLDYWFGSSDEISPPTIAPGALSDESLDEISSKLDGFVGRDISKMVIQIQSSAFATEDNKITKELIDRVIDRKLKERKELVGGFKRSDEGTSNVLPPAA